MPGVGGLGPPFPGRQALLTALEVTQSKRRVILNPIVIPLNESSVKKSPRVIERWANVVPNPFENVSEKECFRELLAF